MAPLFEPGGLVKIQDGPPNEKVSPSSSRTKTIGSWYEMKNDAIGNGRFSEVLRASQRVTGAPRAVKVIKKHELPKAEIRSDGSGLGCRELDILRRLDHPNVIRLYEAFEDDQHVYLVLELCEGGDLLERVNGTKERMPETEVAIVFSQTLCAVEHLWSHGVAHRDLKPEHFVYSDREAERDPLPPRVPAMKLIDFGLSRRVDRQKLEAAAANGVPATPREKFSPRIGTVEFMSPETVKGTVKGEYLHKVDIWSLGVLLHIMLTGRYLSPRLAEMTTAEYFSKSCWRNIDPECLDLLGMLLQQEPSKRPTATLAMRHPYMLKALGAANRVLVQRLPIAARAFTCTSELRQLALFVAAREADDSDVAEVRRLYHLLQVACSGSLTYKALQQAVEAAGDEAAGGTALGAVAAALVRSFDCVDSDGSGAIDWTELVAVTLGVADTLVSAVAPKAALSFEEAKLQQGIPACKKPPPLPPLREEHCWRAFDLLSQGAGAVTSSELAKLLCTTSQASTTPSGTKPSGGDSPVKQSPEPDLLQMIFCAPGGLVQNMCGADCHGGDRGEARRNRASAAAAEAAGVGGHIDLLQMERLDRIVWEASPTGVLDGKAFLRMIQTPVYTSEKNGGRLVFV